MPKLMLSNYYNISLTNPVSEGHDMVRVYFSFICSIMFPVFCFSILSSSTMLYAGSLDYPKSCYAGTELEAVRQWEKTWAGKTISHENVDQVKDFLPETLHTLMKDTKRWGESWFHIVPYRQILPTPGTITATKQYNGRSKVNEQGEIINWVAGVPFPDTDDALKMAHNFRCRNYGDTQKTLESGFIVDGKLKYDLKLEIQNNFCFFSGRVDMPPLPELSNNPQQIWRAFHMVQTQPPEVRNMRILETHYKDRLRSYDSWFWMPTIRRMRRRSTSERQDSQGGADFCGFDNYGWDGPISLNTYRYLGAKELLLSRHQSYKTLEHDPGICLWNGVQRERIKAHILEVTNNDPNFLYSKMIWYLDPESWQILYSDRYDRQGRLWKVLDQLGFLAPGYKGVEVCFMAGNQMIDVQRTHSTLATGKYEFGISLPETMFTTSYLQKHGY